MYNHSFQNGMFYCVQLTNYLYTTNAVLISARYHSFVHKNFKENQKRKKKRNHEVCCREVGRCPFDIVLKTKGP